MNAVQQRAIAAGFLHALQTTPELFNEWNGIDKSDYAKIGTLIAQTVGLATTPTVADLQAMAAYIDSHLGDQVTALQKAHADAPSHVGFVVVMQQNS